MDWRRRISNLGRELRGLWGSMRAETVAIGALLIGAFSVFMVVRGGKGSSLYNHQSSSCQFPAIYNFGDSNSDTGAVSAAFGRVQLPYGETFFHKPAGRYSDGRLIIDFIAERLGLPFLSAYLDSIGTNFRHGANFAASGCTIQSADAIMLNRTFNPFTLDVQLLQFEQFKDRSAELYNEAKRSDIKARLPRSEDYTRALYTFDIGQNDIHAGIVSMKEEQVKTYIPTIINEFASAIEKLYQGGARTFWIHNTGPIGCLPFFVKNYPPAPKNTDPIGCVKSFNEIAQDFNIHLKNKVTQLGKELQEASLVYVDLYAVKYSLISEANEHGFTDPLGQCLGQDENGGGACVNPLAYINWDGIHYTEAANKWVASRIQDGSASDPRIPISEACQVVLGSNFHDNV